MSFLKRMIYMGFGALLALAFVVGGVAVFAQSGDDGETGVQDGAEEDTLLPEPGPWVSHSHWPAHHEELLAEALGIDVEALQAAYDDARDAAIEQALEEGLITEEQAERMREGRGAFRFGRRLLGANSSAIDSDELLAEALGISVEELQEARSQVRAAELEALVEAGALTQEQADLMAAREAVTAYIDHDALAAMIQDAYEAAVEAALDAGDITQAQADGLLEESPAFGLPGAGSFRFDGSGHHEHRFGPGAAGTFVPGIAVPASGVAALDI